MLFIGFSLQFELSGHCYVLANFNENNGKQIQIDTKVNKIHFFHTRHWLKVKYIKPVLQNFALYCSESVFQGMYSVSCKLVSEPVLFKILGANLFWGNLSHFRHVH